jgi:hypothetical protein
LASASAPGASAQGEHLVVQAEQQGVGINAVELEHSGVAGQTHAGQGQQHDAQGLRRRRGRGRQAALKQAFGRIVRRFDDGMAAGQHAGAAHRVGLKRQRMAHPGLCHVRAWSRRRPRRGDRVRDAPVRFDAVVRLGTDSLGAQSHAEANQGDGKAIHEGCHASAQGMEVSGQNSALRHASCHPATGPDVA